MVEGGYLEPDMKNQYGYLDAIKSCVDELKVRTKKWQRYYQIIKLKQLRFYLPQYHAIPENDKFGEKDLLNG